jgi:hypothetical protein
VPTEPTESNGHDLIDQVYNKAETFVAGVGAVLGVDVRADNAPSSPAATVGPDRQIPTSPAPARPALPAPKAAERAFEIVEVVGRGGSAIAWIVTNGIEKAECGSLAIASAVLDHLNRAIAAKKAIAP